MIIHNGNYIVHDAFIRGDKLYLVSTYYSHDNPSIKIYVNDELTKEEGYNAYEPMKYYWCPAPSNPTIDIRIEDKIYTITVEVIENTRQGALAVATLFKGDCHRIENFCKHYRVQGVERFYLYYNGPTLPTDIYNASDIEYRCWDFPYWNTEIGQWRHHAQTAFLTSMYLRNLPRYDWFGLIDLDEIMYCSEKTVGQYLIDKPETVSCVKIKNHWAKYENNELYYTLVPTESGRTKCFYRGSYPYLCAIHTPKRYYNVEMPSDIIMIHYIDNKDSEYRHRERSTQIVEPTATLKWF